MSGLIPADDGALARRATFQETSLTLDPDTPYEEWAQIGVTLGRVHRVSAWWLADWVNFGERVYGEMYAQAINDTGLAYQTLANYASVGRQIAVSRRRNGISFSHHADVASLEPVEQDRWLGAAEENNWTRSELRNALQGGGYVLMPRKGQLIDLVRKVIEAAEPTSGGFIVPEEEFVALSSAVPPARENA